MVLQSSQLTLLDRERHRRTQFFVRLLLQCLMGMPCEEIAAVMGLSVGATMTRLTRARLKF